jgi:hypothetical protein
MTPGSTVNPLTFSLRHRPANLRSAYRDGIEPTLRRSFTGFQVARTL